MKGFKLFLPLLFVLVANLEIASQCTLSLSAKRSGCYISGGQSKYTISVEVDWTNAPLGESIIITGPPGSVPATRTITPGTITVTYAANNSGGTVTSTQDIVSPQVVAFELDANSATGLSVTGAFSTTTSCSATSNLINAPAPCQPLDCVAGNLGGTVFFDFNSDGIKQSDEIETGVANVTVTAVDVNGNSYTTTSLKYGRWVISGIPSGSYPLRVEFSNLPAYARQGTLRGIDGNTTVQFIQSADCNVDLGVLNNTDYCDQKPPIFTPCYIAGNPENSGSGSRDKDVFVMFDYDASGAKDPTKITSLAYTQHVGSLWGVAYNKYTEKIFTSATIKRHVGMGPEGIGGIYVLDKNATVPGIVTSWDVNGDFGINVGTFPSNTARGLPNGVTTTNIDLAGFTEIGKVGIGDIDISENGNQLYFVNLFDKKLYRLNLTAYNTSGALPTTDANWTIPDPGCTNGNFRPFAVKWYKGVVYVGAICDGTTGTKSDMRAYVYRLNPSTGVWTTIFDFPLTYPKGFPNSGDRTVTGWYPWTDNWSDFEIVKNLDEIAYPQPILTDIEIDVEGSLILGFADRGAFQTGYRAVSTDPNNSQLYSGFAGGDIIKAYDNGTGTYVLENNAKAGPTIGYGPANSQGPGFGEYYNDDWFSSSNNLNHAECVMGGLALRSGSGQVITTHVDPVDFINWSGGVRHYNNSNGLTDYGFVLYRTTDGDVGTFGKAAGLGDLEIACALPTFIEIGNRVWADADNDGTQDPDESPLSGVRVQLYKQDGTLIATTLTNSSGEYYFSSSNPQMADPNLNWVGTGMDAMIQPSSPYYLVFGSGQYSGGQLVLGGNNYILTVANNESPAPANNSNDSDAT
nr:SdrD B-like domain-containing protein [Saprospiraceae bacterium]